MKHKDINLKSLKAALDAVPGMVAIKSADGTYLYANKTVNDYYKNRFDSIVGKTIDDVYPPKEAKYVKSLDNRVLESNAGFTEEISILTDNGYIHSEISRFPVFDDNNNIEYIISLGFDITERVQMQAEIKSKVTQLEDVTEKYKILSYHDVLTGVYNRRKLYEDLTNLDSSVGNCFVLLDLNNFKLINDQFGHNKGDEVLREFAKYLREITSKENANTYRIGGDEFAVLFPETSIDFTPYLQQLDMFLKKYHKDVSVSYGSTNIDTKEEIDNVHTSLIISRADVLLYQFKNQVKGK